MRLTYLTLQATSEGQAAHAHVHEIVSNLKKLGWEVTVVGPGDAAGIDVSLPRRLWRLLTTQMRLISFAGTPDIVYIRAHFAAVLVAVWASLRRIPVVQEINGPFEDVFIAYPWAGPFRRVVTFMARMQLRLAKGFVAVTPQLADWVQVQGGVKPTAVIPNGVNADLFRPRETDLEEPYAVFVGALAAWQGIEDVLEAAQLPEWPRGLRLAVVGDGVMRQAVEDAAARQAHIHYWGRLPYRDVPRVLARAVVALSPQRNLDGRADTGLYPLKVFEALACGVPVVVTDFPGQADLVRSLKCGLVVPEARPTEIASAVARIFSDQELRSRMSSAAVAARPEISWRYRAQQTDRFLRELASMRRED